MTDLSFDGAIGFARDLIRIPSLPGEEGELAARVQAELERLGFADVRVDDVGNVTGRAPGSAAAPAVMLSCHLDAVDVGDAAAWEHPPFAADIDGGFLHGRGAMDIKGPLAIQTYAAAHFLDAPLPGDVIVAHTVLEERGGLGMAHLMEATAGRPGAVIIGEATDGDICIGHRGRAELVIEIQGVAGHASAPERAHNPIDLLDPLVAALRDFAATLDHDPVLGRSTLAPTAIETLPKSRNVIPDRVRIFVDWRVLPGSSADRLAARLREHLRHAVAPAQPFDLRVDVAVETQTTCTGRAFERPLFTPGYLLAPDHPVATAAARAAANAGLQPTIRPWTFATDGGHTCGIHGIPTVGFGPGEERHAHTRTERLDLARAARVFAAYPSVIGAVQAAAGPVR
jgi:putative selenium metabolism hydrolase